MRIVALLVALLLPTIAGRPDVGFIASTDLGSFPALRQGDARYEALVTRAREAITRAGRTVGGPVA